MRPAPARSRKKRRKTPSQSNEPLRANSALGLAAKLAICVVASTAAFFALFGYINLRDGAQPIPRTWCKQSADRITDVILRSTHYEMLHNDREALYNIIRELGSEPGIRRIRIFNKEGRITLLHRRRRVEHGGGQERRGLLRLPPAVGSAGQAEPPGPRAHFHGQAGAAACWA